eukprot:2804193-Amphidinium_carterae.1
MYSDCVSVVNRGCDVCGNLKGHHDCVCCMNRGCGVCSSSAGLSDCEYCSGRVCDACDIFRGQTDSTQCKIKGKLSIDMFRVLGAQICMNIFRGTISVDEVHCMIRGPFDGVHRISLRSFVGDGIKEQSKGTSLMSRGRIRSRLQGIGMLYEDVTVVSRFTRQQMGLKTIESEGVCNASEHYIVRGVRGGGAGGKGKNGTSTSGSSKGRLPWESTTGSPGLQMISVLRADDNKDLAQLSLDQ